MPEKNSNKDVIELYLAPTILPEVPVLGWQRFRQGTRGGKRPGQLPSYEICYVDKGSVEWWIDHQLVEAGAKTLFINKPGEWHGGESGYIQPCEMYFVQFMFPPKGQLPGLSPETVLELHRVFKTIQRPFNASADIKLFFDLLLGEQRKPGLASVSFARAAFQQLLITTLRDHAKKEALSHSEGIARVINWIHHNLEQDIYSDTLAQLSEMSVAQFYKRFSQEVGLTPAEYHLRQRILIAKQQLRTTDDSITDIALQLGLSSSQYFATVFKKIVGLTPGEYRRLS